MKIEIAREILESQRRTGWICFDEEDIKRIERGKAPLFKRDKMKKKTWQHEPIYEAISILSGEIAKRYGELREGVFSLKDKYPRITPELFEELFMKEDKYVTLYKELQALHHSYVLLNEAFTALKEETIKVMGKKKREKLDNDPFLEMMEQAYKKFN